ncbi:MAG: holo-ACP synthase [Clostridiales bacterium]|jgi:holo-[acyl-carrier-protein] synthase|nr:holo-ACP synthase [Clostridiales bacterium]
MNIKIGIDIIEIDRIKKAIKKHKKFLSRNFSEQENEYFSTNENVIQTVAGNFAAKEAFSKSIGTGIRGFSLIDIEILRNKNKKPILLLKKKIQNCDLSITHSKENAIAVVIYRKNFLKHVFNLFFYNIFHLIF